MKSQYIRKMRWTFGYLIFAIFFATIGYCQEPVKLSVCQLKNNPAAHNHQLVEVTAFVSHGFEDFTLFDPTCSSWPLVWLEYGGKVSSGTMYCCGVTPARSRLRELVVEKIHIPLVRDESFEQFDRLVQRSPNSVVHATVVGRFFSGRQIHYPKAVYWGGYGHMGCCTLLAIHQVISTDPQDRDDLDYGGSPDQPYIRKVGCGFQMLTPPQAFNDLIAAQRTAELGGRDWVFDDPKHVALDALAHLLQIDEASITGLKQTDKAQGRLAYEWRPGQKGVSYMVVVSRPYWLTFYSKDPKQTAWIVFAAYKSSCGEGNAVKRIR
jgi:hypothetical protein